MKNEKLQSLMSLLIRLWLEILIILLLVSVFLINFFYHQYNGDVNHRKKLCPDGQVYQSIPRYTEKNSDDKYNCCYEKLMCLNNGYTDKCYYEVKEICEGYIRK